MKKLYSIEFLRVWFTCLIIIGHTIFTSDFNAMFALKNGIFHDMGSYVNIFFLIAGFFLYKSYKSNIENGRKYSFAIVHRMSRLLPALLTYKVLSVIFLGISGRYLLSNLFMLNQNIGISIPTQTHIIWFVDVMFWVYIFYISIMYVLYENISLFITAILTYISLCILFMSPDVNIHFDMAYAFLDGGVLRGIGFMGMGILLSAIPYKEIKFNTTGKCMLSVMELFSFVMVFLFPQFNRINSAAVLNYVLWAVIFLFLASCEYGFVFKFLNNQSWINKISKYSYEAYVFQLFAITLGYKWFSPHQAPIITGIIIIILSFLFGKLFKDYIEPFLFNIGKHLLQNR